MTHILEAFQHRLFSIKIYNYCFDAKKRTVGGVEGELEEYAQARVL